MTLYGGGGPQSTDSSDETEVGDMSNRKQPRQPSQAERELVEMTGGAIPADDLMEIAAHSHWHDGHLMVDVTGMRLLAKWSPLGEKAVEMTEQLIVDVEKHYAAKGESDE